jgi:hypothetical protein
MARVKLVKVAKRRAVLAALLAVGLGASCSSITKESNQRLVRGREGDEAKPKYDHSLYVQNTTDPDVTGKDFRAHPRNYKFSVAVAPLYIEFRKGSPPTGEPPENFADTVLEGPLSDDTEARNQAPIPPEDLFAGVPLKTEAERQATEKAVAVPSSATSTGQEGTAVPESSSTGQAPPAPAETPAAPPAPAETPKPVESPAAPPAPVETPKPVESPAAPPAPAETPKPVESPAAPPAPAETPKPVESPAAPPAPAETPKPVESPAAPPPAPAESPAPQPSPKPKGHRIGKAPVPGDASRRFGATEGTPTPAPEVAAESTANADVADRDEIQRISGYEGMNFAIDPTGYQKRMGKLLNEFRVFENVDTDIRFNEQKSLDDLFEKAEAAGDDFLLVSRLRRNKVSYRGVDLGPAIGDDLLWIAFWIPSEFFGFIAREQYRCDVELYVQLYDVRSRVALVDKTFKGQDLLVLTGSERGYQLFGPFTIAATSWYRHEALFSAAGEWVRPGAWIHMESQLLDHLENRLKKDLDRTEPPTFEDLTNGKSVRPKQLALVCGIKKYGERAAPKLREWASGSADPAVQAVAEKSLIQDYDNQEVELGTRPYAEYDAKRMTDLLHRHGALESEDGVSPGNVFELVGKDATLAKLRGAFRQLARSRREDRVFVYLNGETIVLDDPEYADETAKYFLPYDIDLDALDALAKQAQPGELRKFLDTNALSFDWIYDCVNKSGPDDHVYLESRHAFVVVDCNFPGTFSQTQFCPKRARKASRETRGIGYNFGLHGTGDVTSSTGTGEVTSSTGTGNGPGPGTGPDQTPKPETPKAETPGATGPEVPKAPVESPKAETPAPETPKAPVETPGATGPEVPKAPVESPKAETPAPERPKPVETPGATGPEVPKAPVESPKVETPAPETPGATGPEVPKAPVETPGATGPEVPKAPVESPKAETPAPETPGATGPEVPKAPVESPKPVETPKVDQPNGPPPATPRGHRIGFLPSGRVPVDTMPAGDPAAVGSAAPAAVSEFISTSFLERLVTGGVGRTLILTSAPDELALDLPGVKQGGFVYYFTQFLDKSDRVKTREDGSFLGRTLVEYATDRIEAESRQVGRPQHVLVFGDRGDFVVVKGMR